MCALEICNDHEPAMSRNLQIHVCFGVTWAQQSPVLKCVLFVLLLTDLA